MDAACRRGKNGSMRQILNMPSTPGCRNAFTCGFSTRKGRCARGFPNLPHTSVQRFRKCGVKPRSADQHRFCAHATCGFVAENRVALGDFRFFPHFRKTRQRRASRSENRYEFRWKNNLLNAKTAFRRFPRTKPDVPSQGLITVGTLRKNPISVNPLPASRSELRLSSNASVKLHVSRKTSATTSFPNRDVSFDRPNLTPEQKEGRRINPLQVSPEGLHRNCPYSSR